MNEKKPAMYLHTHDVFDCIYISLISLLCCSSLSNLDLSLVFVAQRLCQYLTDMVACMNVAPASNCAYRHNAGIFHFHALFLSFSRRHFSHFEDYRLKIKWLYDCTEAQSNELNVESNTEISLNCVCIYVAVTEENLFSVKREMKFVCVWLYARHILSNINCNTNHPEYYLPYYVILLYNLLLHNIKTHAHTNRNELEYTRESVHSMPTSYSLYFSTQNTIEICDIYFDITILIRIWNK